MKIGWRLLCSVAHHGLGQPVGRCQTSPSFTTSGSPIRTLLSSCCGRSTGRPTRTAIATSRFCELYQRWRRKQDVVLRQEHKAGEKLFVDWAGDTIPIYDARGGPVQQAHLFVAVLGASSYTYAEVTPDEQLASWIGAHVRAFEFFQGTPKLVVPDNAKTRRYEGLPLRS